MRTWTKAPDTISDADRARYSQAVREAYDRVLASPAFRSGDVSGRWTKVPDLIAQDLASRGMALPDGYAANMNGEFVYTNQTPLLRQLAETAGPTLGGASLASWLLPGAAAAGGAGATLPGGSIPGWATAMGGYAGPSVTSAGVGGVVGASGAAGAGAAGAGATYAGLPGFNAPIGAPPPGAGAAGAGGGMGASVWPSLINGGINLFGSLMGNRSQSAINQQSLAQQLANFKAQQAFLEQQAARDQANWERAQAEDTRRYNEMMSQQKAQWDAQQQVRAPYRAAAQNVLGGAFGSGAIAKYPGSGATLGSMLQGRG